jgi:cell division protein FtsL
MLTAAPARSRQLPLLLLMLAVVASALAVSWSVYHARSLTSEVQQLKSEQNRLNVEWGQLQLENSTWGAYVRVEKLAADKLDMIQPSASQRVVVTP